MKMINYFFILPVLCALSLSQVLAADPIMEKALFAGGCFWSMQHDFEGLKGVVSTTVGYTGGSVVNPTYEQVSSGKTGHYESIQIIYNPKEISYQKLVDFYMHDTDPTDESGQFCDKGSEYRPVIFYFNLLQKQTAINTVKAIQDSRQFKSIATQILPAQPFYPAEEYHQHFSDKNPEQYGSYRRGCQRDATLSRVWGR